jgi:Asp-tRNA(Asn)/Glu-tRNA(Gln) amidotransferase C subunit
MIKLKDLLLEDVSQTQLNQVEKYLDKLWAKVGIDVEFTRHFMDRVNDVRNGKPISPAELIKIYREIYKKYGKTISQLKSGAEILLKDMETDINVPVVLKWDGKEFDMISKTVMRKKNFKSSTKKYSI